MSDSVISNHLHNDDGCCSGDPTGCCSDEERVQLIQAPTAVVSTDHRCAAQCHPPAERTRPSTAPITPTTTASKISKRELLSAVSVVAVLLTIGITLIVAGISRPGPQSTNSAKSHRYIPPFYKGRVPSGPSAATVLVLGDFGRVGRYHQRQVAKAMATEVFNTNNTKAIVSVGDNLYPAGASSVNDPMFFRSWEDVYIRPYPEFKSLPWWFALGNHDYLVSPESQIKFNHSLWNFPGRFYNFKVNISGAVCASFVIMDTNPFVQDYIDGEDPLIQSGDFPAFQPAILAAGRTNDEQQVWLEHSLRAANHDCLWTFLVGHHPMGSDGFHGHSAAIRAIVDPLCAQFNFTYLSGHDHTAQRLISQGSGCDQLITGAASRPDPYFRRHRQSVFRSAHPSFLSIALDEDLAVFRFIDATGRVIHSFAKSARTQSSVES